MAAAKKLKSFVHVHEYDDDGNILRTEVFGPEDKLPAWAKKHLGDHVWEDGDDDEVDPLDPGYAIAENVTAEK